VTSVEGLSQCGKRAEPDSFKPPNGVVMAPSEEALTETVPARNVGGTDRGVESALLFQDIKLSGETDALRVVARRA
jgi:hypothetical protein